MMSEFFNVVGILALLLTVLIFLAMIFVKVGDDFTKRYWDKRSRVCPHCGHLIYTKRETAV